MAPASSTAATRAGDASSASAAASSAEVSDLLVYMPLAWCLSLLLLALYVQHPISPVFFVRFGHDFRDFWTASKDWSLGLNPYERPRFVTPPLAIFLQYPLIWVDVD